MLFYRLQFVHPSFPAFLFYRIFKNIFTLSPDNKSHTSLLRKSRMNASLLLYVTLHLNAIVLPSEVGEGVLSRRVSNANLKTLFIRFVAPLTPPPHSSTRFLHISPTLCPLSSASCSSQPGFASTKSWGGGGWHVKIKSFWESEQQTSHTHDQATKWPF